MPLHAKELDLLSIRRLEASTDLLFNLRVLLSKPKEAFYELENAPLLFFWLSDLPSLPGATVKRVDEDAVIKMKREANGLVLMLKR